MLVTIPTTNLIQGVSQQPPQMRLSSQATEQINCYSSPTEGLTKRPPTQFVGVLENCPGTATTTTHFIDRDTAEKYVLALDGSTLKAWTLAGAAVPVYGTNYGDAVPTSYTTYMTGATSDSTRVMSVADYSFILNRSKTAAAVTAPVSTVRNEEALVTVTQGAYKTNYTIYLKVGSASEQTFEVKTWNGQAAVAGETSSIKTDDIAAAFKALSSWPSGLAITQYGSTLHIQATGATPVTFTIRTTDSAGDAILIACKGSVPRLSDLPMRAPNNFKIAVSPDPDVVGSKYWVKFVVTSSEADGVWEETVAPGVLYALDKATMPFVLKRKFDSTFGIYFSVEEGPWLGRDIGDLTTNPWPSFVGQTIQDMFFFKNRLGFLASDKVILSETGSYFNFFRTTVAQLIDSDPIDVGTLNTSVSTLRAAVPHGEHVIIFSDQAQFMLGTSNNDPLTPGTAVSLKTTEFSSASNSCRPVSIGRSIFFLQADARYAGMREYFQTSTTSNQYDGQDVTAHVNAYITGTPAQLSVSSYDNLAVIRTSASVTATNGSCSLWNYKWLMNGGERIQSAWSRWDFPSCLRILGITWLNKKLYMVIVRGSAVHLEYMDFEIRTPDPENFLPHLDCIIAAPSQTYGNTTGLTTVPSQVGTETVDYSVLPVVAVVSGREAPIAQVTSSTVSVYGNATPYKIYFGIKYDMTYQFSPIYLRNQNIPVLDGRVTLTYGSISYSDTGFFKVAVDVRYRSSTSYTYFGGSLDASYSTDAVNLDKGSFRFPIHGRNEDATVTVSTNSHFPIRLNAASFEAQYVTRTR